MSSDANTPVDIFFYGLFMDTALLSEKGIRSSETRRARLDGYRLSIGERATLLEHAGYSVHGVLMRIARADLQRLYSEPSVSMYRPEQVAVVLEDGTHRSAAAYVLPPDQHEARANPRYAAKLHELASRLDLPRDYLQEILRSTIDESKR